MPQMTRRGEEDPAALVRLSNFCPTCFQLCLSYGSLAVLFLSAVSIFLFHSISLFPTPKGQQHADTNQIETRAARLKIKWNRHIQRKPACLSKCFVPTTIMTNSCCHRSDSLRWERRAPHLPSSGPNARIIFPCSTEVSR